MCGRQRPSLLIVQEANVVFSISGHHLLLLLIYGAHAYCLLTYPALYRILENIYEHQNLRLVQLRQFDTC